jgi:virginiamycin B lyase
MTLRTNARIGSLGFCLFLLALAPAYAQQPRAALSGQVSFAAEGALEGVLVSARRDGSTITTTVVSDAKGHYSFPADRLQPGHYAVTIRAAGYDLQGPKAADVVAGKDTTADLTLTKTNSLGDQLSNAEWLSSFPLADEKKQFMIDCVGCHTLQRPADSTFNESQFRDILRQMATFSAESVPGNPQPLLPGPRIRTPSEKALAAETPVLAEFNLSKGSTHSYPLKTFPRPQGRATHVIITQYDLPRKTWQPHDVIVGKDGKVWFSDFANDSGHQYVGEMDPKTGKVTQIEIPLMKKDGSPVGTLDIEQDPSGNIWLANMYQGGIVEVDAKTHKVKQFPLPQQYQNTSTQESFVSPQNSNVDGYVWTNDQDKHTLIALNVKTGQFGEMVKETTPDGVAVPAYQIPTNLQNDVYLLNFGGTLVGMYEKDSGAVSAFKTPTPRSRPRRGEVDHQNRLWFAEYAGNSIGMFDPKTKQIKEWAIPVPWAGPYDAVYADKYDQAWAASQMTDMVDCLDVKTGQFTDYLLPLHTNMRRVYVDQSGPRPVVWVGSNHDASVIRIEPLD